MTDPKEKKQEGEEHARRRDELARRILNTPPEPRSQRRKDQSNEKRKPAK